MLNWSTNYSIIDLNEVIIIPRRPHAMNCVLSRKAKLSSFSDRQFLLGQILAKFRLWLKLFEQAGTLFQALSVAMDSYGWPIGTGNFRLLQKKSACKWNKWAKHRKFWKRITFSSALVILLFIKMFFQVLDLKKIALRTATLPGDLAVKEVFCPQKCQNKGQ